MPFLLAFLLWACCAASTVPVHADSAWVDDVWYQHLVYRAAQVEDSNPVLAEAFLREAIRLDPDAEHALIRLADLYDHQGEDALALAIFTYMRIQELDTTAVEWDADTKQVKLADRPSRPETEEEVSGYEAALERVNTAVGQDDFIRAEQILRVLLRAYPRDPQLLLELGHIYAVSRDWPMFTALYACFHQWYPATFDIFNNLCVGLEQLGHVGRAFDLIEQRLNATPAADNVYLISNAVRLAQAAGRMDAAARWARRWLEVAPEEAEPRVVFARLLLARGESDAAQEQLKRAWELDSQRADVCYFLAELHAREGRNGEALRWLERLGQRADRADFEYVLSLEPFASLKGVETLKASGDPSP